MSFDRLRPEQGPPLWVPVGFYAVAPAAMGAFGLLLAALGDAGLDSRWSPGVLAATHLGTLGYLGSIMLGSLFQIAPVVAGAPVRGARYAPALVAAWVVGIAALVTGFLAGSPTGLLIGAAALGLVLGTVLLAAGVALAFAPTRSTTVTGLRLSLGGLLAVATLGVVLATARAGAIALPTPLLVTVDGHAALGALVWVGGLMSAVSWQVVPMFYLATPLPGRVQTGTLVALGASGVALLAVVGFGGGWWLVAAAAPAAVMVLGVHPLLTARAILTRRRRRADGSASFWLAGLACAPVVLALAVGATIGSDPRWTLALGWVAIWGWAGLVTHGMLCRIVPFLVWFHRFTPLVGKVPVPSIKALLPERWIARALWSHGTAVVLGLIAIVTGWDPLVRLAGVALIVAAVILAANLTRALNFPVSGSAA